MEYIKAEPGDYWICVCGNEPSQDGFYPCDRRGNQVEPTVKDWTGIYYVCDRCGRIIDQRNLRVVGRCPESGAAKLGS